MAKNEYFETHKMLKCYECKALHTCPTRQSSRPVGLAADFDVGAKEREVRDAVKGFNSGRRRMSIRLFPDLKRKT
jgi:hypothetical protein